VLRVSGLCAEAPQSGGFRVIAAVALVGGGGGDGDVRVLCMLRRASAIKSKAVASVSSQPAA